MRLKVYGITLWVPASPPESNGNRQRRCIVAAQNQQVAAACFGVSTSYLRTYGGETGNSEEIEVATREPMMVLWEYKGSWSAIGATGGES